MVGVAKPIYINFQRPIANKPMAEQAIHISSIPPVPGRFYWVSDTQVRWRPQDFWPANTVVNIDASGAKSSFRVGESLVATIDNKNLKMEIMRNGKLDKTFPVSMGKKGHDTPNGTYYVLEKFADIVMDSSTYGVPVDSADGYKLKVQDAVRIDNSGTFVHSAPWSVGSQGKQQCQPRLHQPQPGQRAVVLRQLRQRRPDRHQELRRHVQQARRRVRLADLLSARQFSSRSAPDAAGRGTARRSR